MTKGSLYFVESLFYVEVMVIFAFGVFLCVIVVVIVVVVFVVVVVIVVVVMVVMLLRFLCSPTQSNLPITILLNI